MKRILRDKKRGFSLIEVILAVTVFSIMAVGFLRIMDKAAQFTTLVQREALLRNRVANYLDSFQTNTTLSLGTETQEADGDGIALESTIENLNLRNTNQVLLVYYRIRVTAIPPNGNKDKGLTVEKYVYQP